MAALKNKTFRATDDIFDALRAKATELKISESDVVNNALRCYLGLDYDENCASYNELQKLSNRFDALIRLNNLKTEAT